LPLVIKPVFQAGDAEADFNKYMQGLAAKANLPIKPSFVPPTGGAGDPLKSIGDGAAKTGQQIEKLQAQLGKLFENADFDKGSASLDQLRERAEKAELEFSKARLGVRQFSDEIAGIDFTNADPKRAKVLADEMSRLGDIAKTSFGEATQATKDYEQALARAEKATKEVTSATERTAKSVASDFDDIKDSSERAAKASEGLLSMERLKTGIGAMGDLKDIVEKAGTALFGFSQETTDALVLTGDLAEKGAAVGESFGPMGALIGGVAGAMIGYATAAKQAAAAARELAAAEKLKRQEMQLSVGGLSASLQGFALDVGVDVFGLSGKSIEELEARHKKLGDVLKQEGEFALDAAKKYEALSMSQTASKKDLADAKAASDMYAASLREKRLEQVETKKAIDAYNQALEATADITDVVVEKAEKAAKSGSSSSKKKASAPVGLSSGEDPMMDIEGMREAREELNNLTEQMWLLDKATLAGDPGDSLIGQLGRDLVLAEDAAEKLNQELAKVPPLPPLPDFGDEDDITQVQAMSDAISGLFNVWVQEGERLDKIITGISESFVHAGASAAGAIGGAATGAFGELFDAMAKNEEMLEPFGKAFQRKAAEALRATGSELIGDGVANMLKAGAMFFIPGMKGNAAGLAAAGGAEIATGLAMGGAGIGIGRRAGVAPEGSGRGDRGAGGSTGPSSSEVSTSPTAQAPIVINITGVQIGEMTERDITELGDRLHHALERSTSNTNRRGPFTDDGSGRGRGRW
jgi:hypothetical protein